MTTAARSRVVIPTLRRSRRKEGGPGLKASQRKISRRIVTLLGQGEWLKRDKTCIA